MTEPPGLGVYGAGKAFVLAFSQSLKHELADKGVVVLVTVPSLPDAADWNAYQSARQALRPNLSRATPARRYGVGARGAALENVWERPDVVAAGF